MKATFRRTISTSCAPFWTSGAATSNGQRRRADRRDPAMGPGGAARPMAAAVAQRLRKGYATAGARLGGRQRPGADRRGAEPAGLPGRRGRSSHPLRQRGARFVKQAMAEYGELTGRFYSPVKTYQAEDADHVIVGLGSVTDDAEAVAATCDGRARRSAWSRSSCCSPSRKGS